jgi:folate-binding protein YgfZ
MTDTAITPHPTYLSNRAIIRLSPKDEAEKVRDFLQGLLTQDMNRVVDGACLWSALLSAQGKLLFEFLLWDGGEDILIDCEAKAAPALIRRLSLYRLRRKIGIALDDGLAVHWSTQKPAIAAQPDPRLSALGYRWLDASADAAPIANNIWLEHRLKHGIAEGQAEFGEEKILWLECNAEELNGVSYTKGCFIGQENTARMHYRSKVNRRVAIVPIGLAEEKRVRHVHEDFAVAIVHAPIANMVDWPLAQWQKAAISAG